MGIAQVKKIMSSTSLGIGEMTNRSFVPLISGINQCESAKVC